MNAAKLLQELQARAVVLWIEGEGEHAGLGYEAPPGVLKPPVLAAMKASKGELLLLLEAASQAGAQAAPVAQVAPVEVEPPPQVLATRPSPAPEPASTLKPVPESPAARAARERHGRERVRIFAAFPVVRPVACDRWRIGPTRTTHSELLARADRALIAARSVRKLFGCDLDEVAAAIRHEAREQQERERAHIARVFPQSVMLANGSRRIDAGDGRCPQLYDRAGALLLAAQVTGETSNGLPLEAAAEAAAQVLEAQGLDREIF